MARLRRHPQDWAVKMRFFHAEHSRPSLSGRLGRRIEGAAQTSINGLSGNRMPAIQLRRLDWGRMRVRLDLSCHKRPFIHES